MAADTIAAAPQLETISLDRIDLADYRGRVWSLDDFKDDSILVVAFLGTECPLAKHYSLRLREIADEFQPRSVQVIAVMSNRQDSLEEINAFAVRQELEFPVLKDRRKPLCRSNRRTNALPRFSFSMRHANFGIAVAWMTNTASVTFAISRAARTCGSPSVNCCRDKVYRCRGPVPSVASLVAARKSISKAKSPTGRTSPKFLNRRCVECHREGEIAPFSLTDYDEVAGWSDMIAEVVREGRMPPWHATDEHAKFANDRSLTDEEKQALFAWAEAGAPAGDLSDLPELPEEACRLAIAARA